MHDESLAPSADPSETLPPLAASKNPLFPNAVIKRPSNSHAKGASNKSAAKDIASEMTDDEDDQLLIGNTKSTKNGVSGSAYIDPRLETRELICIGFIFISCCCTWSWD